MLNQGELQTVNPMLSLLSETETQFLVHPMLKCKARKKSLPSVIMMNKLIMQAPSGHDPV